MKRAQIYYCAVFYTCRCVMNRFFFTLRFVVENSLWKLLVFLVRRNLNPNKFEINAEQLGSGRIHLFEDIYGKLKM